MSGMGLGFGKMGQMGGPGTPGGSVVAAPNLIPNSNNFAVWALSNAAVPTTGVSDPDGGTDAWLFVDSAPGGSGATRLRSVGITTNVATPHVLSVWVDPLTIDWWFMAWSAGSIIAVQYFDLSLGVPGVVQNDVDSAIMTLDGDFYRCEMRFTTDAVDTAGLVDFRHASADVNSTVPLDGTSNLNIWRAKLEEGTAATPWIDGP